MEEMGGGVNDRLDSGGLTGVAGPTVSVWVGLVVPVQIHRLHIGGTLRAALMHV